MLLFWFYWIFWFFFYNFNFFYHNRLLINNLFIFLNRIRRTWAGIPFIFFHKIFWENFIIRNWFKAYWTRIRLFSILIIFKILLMNCIKKMWNHNDHVPIVFFKALIINWLYYLNFIFVHCSEIHFLYRLPEALMWESLFIVLKLWCFIQSLDDFQKGLCSKTILVSLCLIIFINSNLTFFFPFSLQQNILIWSNH